MHPSVNEDGSLSLEDLVQTSGIYGGQEPLRAHDMPHVQSAQKLVAKGHSILWTMMKSLRIGADLSTLQSPVFFEKGQSALEVGANWMRPTQQLFSLHSLESSVDRMLCIAKWLLEPLADLPSDDCVCVKPYNPILGEQFRCEWQCDDAKACYTAEQVSHHPPIGAGCVYSDRFTISTCFGGTPRFGGNSVELRLVGEVQLKVLQDSGIVEEYEVQHRPPMTVRGIIWGSAHTDVSTGKLMVRCKQSNLQLTIEFKKGSTFSGSISSCDTSSKSKNSELVHIDGDLTKFATYTTVATKQKQEHWIDFTSSQVTALPKVVRPLDQQQPNESRRVWHSVTEALWSGDLDRASHNKNLIEQHQRKLRQQHDFHYETVLFTKTDRLVEGVPSYEYKELEAIWQRIRDDVAKGATPQSTRAKTRQTTD